MGGIYGPAPFVLEGAPVCRRSCSAMALGASYLELCTAA